MDLGMVNPERFQLELKDQLKLIEKLVEQGDLDQAESRLGTLYYSVKNQNM